MILLEYENIKIFWLQKGYIPNWSEEVFVIKKVKIIVPWTHFINEIKSEKIFTKKNRKKQIKKSLELKK